MSDDTPATDPANPGEDPEGVAPDTAEAGPEMAYDCLVTWSRRQRVIHPHRDDWRDTAAALLDDGWTMCVDLTAVDYSAHGADRHLPDGVTPERFEVVASFVSYQRRERIRARAQVPADDPSIDSLYALYPGTDFLEREVYDLMGISFDGHPDLSRILLPETWEGHPLRKDYAIGAIPVQFKAPAGRPSPTGGTAAGTTAPAAS